MNDQHPDDSNGAPEGSQPEIQVPDDASSITYAAPEAAEVAKLTNELGERTADLQRLQAEYVNYKRRVDRDRHVARQSGIDQVVSDLLPVLDAIDAARHHEELDGGFKLVVNALEKVAAKYGLVAFGEVGEEFDPNLHEALMQVPMEGDHTHQIVSSVNARRGSSSVTASCGLRAWASQIPTDPFEASREEAS